MVQKTKVYTIPATGIPKIDHYAIWNTSSRVNGKLVLRPQALTYMHNVERDRMDASRGTWGLPSQQLINFQGNTGPGRQGNSQFWDSLETRALARFNGKLKKGGASLGVTLASWKQSREMISSRLEKAHSIFDRVESNLKKPKRRKPFRDFAQARASDILETEFGWVPLVQDIHSAMTTACDVPDSPWVRARQSAPIGETWKDGDSSSPYYSRTTWEGIAWATISAQCRVSNPNLWLLNRLGLINPATVIWDLVPWSFVVNMFVNVNQVLSSFTDHAGLSFDNVSVTRSRTVTCDYFCAAGKQAFGSDYRGFTSCSQELKDKVRRVGSFPTPSLEFRPPKLNWELAVIASSLLVQKIGRIERLARDVGKAVKGTHRYTE